jgi:hypothetical protein
MDWLGNHLWEFTINHRRYSVPIADDPDWNRRITNATSVKLTELLASGATEISYLYDMGITGSTGSSSRNLSRQRLRRNYPQA